MKLPQLELIPAYPAVRRDASVSLDVLLRVVPPPIGQAPQRLPINLGLVLDHSGSMAAWNKIEFAKRAAAYAVEQLLPTDRVGLTIFETRVRTLVANGPAHRRAEILDAIASIQPAGSTALHEGWRIQAEQVAAGRIPEGINRVLLLTDGLANIGLTEPDAICTQVHEFRGRGVSTTTMGVGEDYNEDLLEAVARAGDGNYFFIDSPSRLPEFFAAEYQELIKIIGTDVALSIEPMRHASLVEVLNGLPSDESGRFLLPNLVQDNPILVVARLDVPPRAVESEIASFRLEWTDPSSGERLEQSVTLTLPTVVESGWMAFSSDSRVQEQVALLEANKAKLRASEALSRGNRTETMACLQESRNWLENSPATSAILHETEELAALARDLEERGDVHFVKKAKYQFWRRQNSK